MSEKTFFVDVAWTMSKRIKVTAKSLEEAGVLAEQTDLNNGFYVEDSFTIDRIEEAEAKVIFDEQLRAAIKKYGDDHVDIMVEGEEVYGVYHSRHNSFAVTDTYTLSELDGIETLKKYEKEFEELCVCED